MTCRCERKNHGFFVSNYSFLKLHTRDRVTDDVTETLKKGKNAFLIQDIHYIWTKFKWFTSNWFDTKLNWDDLRINWMFFAKSIGTSFLSEQLYEMVYKSYVGQNSITNYSNVMKTAWNFCIQYLIHLS